MKEQQLLDKFAAAAMQGLIASQTFKANEFENIAVMAYRVAEAMIAQRKLTLKGTQQ